MAPILKENDIKIGDESLGDYLKRKFKEEYLKLDKLDKIQETIDNFRTKIDEKVKHEVSIAEERLKKCMSDEIRKEMEAQVNNLNKGHTATPEDVVKRVGNSGAYIKQKEREGEVM